MTRMLIQIVKATGNLNILAVVCAVALWLAALPGCKPAPQSGDLLTSVESPKPRRPLSVSVESGEAPAFSPEKMSALQPESFRPVESLATLVQRYYAWPDPERRVELIGLISDAENAAAVNVLGRLFQYEQDTDVKLALLAIVMVQERCPREQLAVLASALWLHQPQEVRLTAVEGLAALRTPAAIQILQGLRSDADLEIRATAVEALGR